MVAKRVVGFFSLALAVSVLIGIWVGSQWFSLPRPVTPIQDHPFFIDDPAVLRACAPGRVCSAPAIQAMSVSPETMETALRSVDGWQVALGTRVILMPHHLVAVREIASLVQAVSPPSVIYLIAPDHFAAGKTIFTTTDRAFDSPFGRVNANVEAGASLTQAVPTVGTDDAPFEREHGITALVPFFARLWPNASLVPIIVRRDATMEDQAALADALAARLQEDPDALIVSTVDFSHELPAFVADFHDVLARDVVESLSDLEVDRVELDSPGALGVTLKIARLLGLGDVTIHAHTNSLRILEAKIAQASTSHLFASFAPGPIRPPKETTMLMVGDMMFDRTVRDRIAASKNPAYPFEAVRGSEGRFFRGQDVVIGNLEGPVTDVRRPPIKSIDFAFGTSIPSILRAEGFEAVSQANNHSLDQGRAGADESRDLLRRAGLTVFGDQVYDDATSSLAIIERRGSRIALLGFNTTDNPLDESAALDAIREARSRAEYVVVFMHWGEEYRSTPSNAQTERAHWFIDQGVDAVIGAHPHWMESVERYKGKLIAYSLGNFIFDQDWSEETNLGLTIGLRFSADGSCEMHLFPISIQASQPRVLTGEERTRRLQHLAEISDPALNSSIESGVLTCDP